MLESIILQNVEAPFYHYRMDFIQSDQFIPNRETCYAILGSDSHGVGVCLI